jgi:hypothetical protein
MNYIILLNQFWQLRREVPFSNAEADLYFCLVEISNGLQWKNPFQQSNALIGATIGVSEKTLINARNRLKQNGLIDFDPGSKRNPSSYRLKYLPNTLEKFQGIKQEQGSTNGSANGSESGSVSGKKPPDIIKHKPKQNKTKQGANAPSAGEQDSNLNAESLATFNEWRQWCAENKGQHGITHAPAAFCTFDIFWDAYGKKVGAKKSRAKWEALPLATRQLALARLPAYVEAWPDTQYRKDPMTWLNGECWNDDIIPRKGAATAQPPAPVVGSLAEKVSTQSKRRYE